MNDIFFALVFSVLNNLGFLLAGFLKNRFPHWQELSRKSAHITSGVLASFYPFFIHSPVVIGVMNMACLLYLIITRIRGQFQEVHGVNRISAGAYLFPVAVFVTFIMTPGRPFLYMAAILTLSLADTAAAIVGTRFGRPVISIDGNRKSPEGLVAFLLTAFLTITLPLLAEGRLMVFQLVCIGLVAALLLTAIELTALWGTDNLLIPLLTVFIITRLEAFPAVTAIASAVQLAVCALAAVILALIGRNAGAGVWIVRFLLLATAITMGGWVWWSAALAYCMLAAIFSSSRHLVLTEMLLLLPATGLAVTSAVFDHSRQLPVFLALLVIPLLIRTDSIKIWIKE